MMTQTITAAEARRLARLFDDDDRRRCVCVHESIVTTLSGSGPSAQCENLTRHPSGRCGDCRYLARTPDGGAVTSFGVTL